MSGWLSRRMVNRGVIKEEDREIYQFGIRNGFIILLNIVTAFLIGLFTEKLMVVCVFTLSFMTLRSFTGGYHCNNRLSCYIGSSLVLFIPVYTGSLFVRLPDTAVVFMLVAAAGIIWAFSPMHSKNRKLDQAEKKHFGKRAKITAILQIAAFFLLWYRGYNEYAYAVYTSICIIAIFMIVGKVQLHIQFHMEK